MSQLLFLGSASLIGIVLTIVVAAAPAGSRTANGIAALLLPTLVYVAWRLIEFIAPMAATIDPRDPVEEFDIWLAGAVALLTLAALTCVVRLIAVALRRVPLARGARLAN
jgi:ABC-type methionine transport system permease subunit